MDKATKRKETVEAVAGDGAESSDALWDELLSKVAPADQSHAASESWSQILEDVEIKDPRLQREFRKKTEQQGPGQ